MRASGRAFLLVLCALVAQVVACGSSESDDATSQSRTLVADDEVPTVVPSPTVTIVPTAAPSPTGTAVPRATGTAVPTVVPSPAVTVVPTAVPSPAVTVVPIDADEPTVTVVPTVTDEAPATPTLTPSAPPPGATSPSTRTGSVPDLPPTDYDGEVRVLRTQLGVMLPIRGVAGDLYEVVTPCYNLAVTSEGLPISGAIDVLLDPGHGGDEPGAVGPNGLKESTVNLRVAELVRDELTRRGFRVELTRYSDYRVAIQARAELANALQPRVFMSIHHNGGYPEPFEVAGTEVFTQLDDPESMRLGGLVFEEIQDAFATLEADWMGNPDTFGVAWRKNDEGTDLYGVLRRTPDLVSVLTEAMFISTAAEADLLAQPEVLELEAVALANAVERWFRTDDEGRGFIEGIVFEGDLGNGGGTEGCVDPDL